MYRHKGNGKAYVGVTKDPKRRFLMHAQGNSFALAFNRAVKKYGIENFDFSILAIFDNVDAANYHENAVIAAFGTLSPNGYNLCGGSPLSRYRGPISQETREKLSLAHRGKKTHPPSQETRQKISQSEKGKIVPLGVRENMSKAHIGLPGHPQSLETRIKLSEAHKGVKETPETCLKMAQAALGRKHTLETREKMSRARKGKPGHRKSPDERAKLAKANQGKKHSLETREKMSLSRKEYLANNPEVIKNLSVSMKANKIAVGNKNRLGKKLSAEKSKKLSLSRKGRVISPEQRKNISDGLKVYNAKKKAEASNAIG